MAMACEHLLCLPRVFDCAVHRRHGEGSGKAGTIKVREEGAQEDEERNE